MKNKISGIYKIQSHLFPDKFYIGSSVDIRSRSSIHFSTLKKNNHENGKLQNHFNKYGDGDLYLSIVEQCDALCLIEREQYYLDTLTPYFNIRKIADRNIGVKFSDEHNKKMSIAKKGSKLSEETKHKISESMKGRVTWNNGLKRTPEHMEKLHSSTRGKKQTPEHIEKRISKLRGRISPRRGIPCPEYVKVKLREANKGQIPWHKGKTGVFSKETLRKMSESQKGKVVSDETRRKMSLAAIERYKKFPSPMRGEHLSQETKDKISKKLKKKKCPR